MAFEIQITEDGPRNVVVLVTGDAAGSGTLLDPALLSATQPPTTQLRVDTIDYILADGVTITLQWDATAPVTFLELWGRGNWSIGKTEGGLQNNAGAGKTGKILYTVSGSGVFSVQMLCVKQSPNYVP